MGVEALLSIDRAYVDIPDLHLTLTKVAGDVVRNVDISVGPLAPLAASAGAGVGVLLGLVAHSDVSLNQDGIIAGAD